MLRAFRLLFPALIPSWNFFDVIAASPRVEYAWMRSSGEAVGDWREFRPRPPRVSLPQMAARLLWNPRWNEALFVVSCAERLAEAPTAHSEDEIFRRIAADLVDAGEPAAAAWLAFRVVFLCEQDGVIVREVDHVAEPRRFESLVPR